MRITQKMMANQVNSSLSKNVEKLMKTQTRISSGKQINQASDDPVGMSKILAYRKNLDSMEQYVRNISNARSGLEAGESILSDIGDVLNRAKELALSQTTGTASPETRIVAAGEVRELRDLLIQLANTKQGDRYIFGGRQTDTPPYDPDATDPEFQGDDGGILVMIADGVTEDMAVSGKRVFGSSEDSVSNDPVVVLSALIQGLQDNDTDAISSQLEPLDQSMTQIINERSDVGARLNRLDSTENHSETFKINIQKILSDTEDLDLIHAATELTAQQTAYQASLSASAKIVKYSLLDYLG